MNDSIGDSTAPFLTGSHVYGSPDDHSDVDIVLRGSHEFAEQLLKIPSVEGYRDGGSDPGHESSAVRIGGSDPGHESSAVRIGPVNLIICHTDRAKEVWESAKIACQDKVLKERRALTRAEAIEIHDVERVKRGLKPS